jgi:TonB family protein
MLKQVGNYTLTERIARGTLSRIYRAVGQQGRPVAIKVSTTPAEPDHLSDFQSDLVAAAGVLHPNLVAVHDLGFEDDFPYLVMELVEGRDFVKVRKNNTPLLLTERINAMLQVADALKTAHERQVFHLDVRPSKIILGDDAVSKLLGLGSGRLCYDVARLTADGYLIGSPLYMSPERLKAIEIADAQCDIWSFGVTLYELIAGKHPFYDDDGERMLQNIVASEPRPLTGLPVSLNRVILRALEKDPSARYRNFAELSVELKPIMLELQREESEALMAQALAQTASGSWHEARNIARKLGGIDAKEASDSSVFELADSEPETPVVLETPAEIPAVTAASVAEAVEESPAPFVPDLILPAKARLEQAVPRIPAVNPKNGAPGKGNGFHSGTRSPLTPGRNGTRVSVSAQAETARASVNVFEPPKATPPSAAPKPKPQAGRRLVASAPGNPLRPPEDTQRSVVAQSPVRVLQFSESRGLPWGKIAGVAAVGLLGAGLFLFFLRQPQRLITAVNASDNPRVLSPAGRVIKPVSSDQPAVSAFSQTNSDQPLSSGSDPAALSSDRADSQGTPRPFDPKSLVVRKDPVRRPKSLMASLAAPSLPANVFVADSASLPAVVFNAPPAPVPLGQTPLAPVPPAAPQTAQPAQISPTPISRSFTQPALVHSVQPVYPATALQRRTQGVVRFQATIAKDGSLKNLHLISGDPLLNVAAKDAVLQWKYRPATLNGAPIEVTQAIIVKFNLDH